MDEEDEDLTVLGVVIFLIKWMYGVTISILSMIPAWILITIALILFIRYLLRPCGE